MHWEGGRRAGVLNLSLGKGKERGSLKWFFTVLGFMGLFGVFFFQCLNQ